MAAPWEKYGQRGVQTKPADPTMPFKAPAAAADLTGQTLSNVEKGVSARVNTATESAQVREARAKADKAEIDAKNARASGFNPMAETEGNLRKEFDTRDEVKTYRDAVTSLGVMLETPDTGGGDIQVIYNFIKAQGPGPVAQGELDLAQSVASFREGLEQKYGKITESNRLPKRVRHELVEASRKAVFAKKLPYDQAYLHYRDLAQQGGVDAERVTGPHLADSITPIEEQYIRSHGGTPRSRNAKDESGGPPEVGFNSAGNAILEDRGRGGLGGVDTGFIGEKGGTHTTVDPRLAGSDAALNSMFKARRPVNEIVGYLKSRGLPDASIAPLMPKILELHKWQGKNPGFKGDYKIDIEQRNDQNSAYQNFINSDVGTGAALGANALAAGIPGAIAGNQDAIQAARSAHPKASFTGEVAGAVGGTMLANKALGAIPSKFLAANPGKQMLLADMGYGGGYGATQNPDNPWMGAALGAGAAAGGNVLGRTVIAPGIRGLGKAVGMGTPALPAGEGMVASQAARADPDAILANLRQAGELKLPYSLADADPRLRSLAGSAVRKSPDAFALASETVGPRAAGQAERALGLINENLAPAGSLDDITADATKRAQAASRPLYDKAMQQAPPEDMALNDMLRNPTMEQVARDAYGVALNKGETPANLSFEIDGLTGQPRVDANPNWRTLQYMKFGLDKAAKQGGDDVGILGRRFNSLLGDLNPDFKAANKAYGNIAKQGEAAQTGYGATSPRVTPSQMQATLGKTPPDQLPYLRQGYASSLADTVERANLGRDPYEAIYGSTAQQKKLGSIFPGAGRFARARGLEKDMSLTSRELLGGSPTQPRAEADKLFEGGGLADAGQAALEVMSGTPPISLFRSKVAAGRFGLGGLRDKYRLGILGNSKEKADQIAPILLNQNPDEVAAILQDMLRREALRRNYVSKTGMLGSSIGTPTAIGLTQR